MAICIFAGTFLLSLIHLTLGSAENRLKGDLNEQFKVTASVFENQTLSNLAAEQALQFRLKELEEKSILAEAFRATQLEFRMQQLESMKEGARLRTENEALKEKLEQMEREVQGLQHKAKVYP